MRRPYWRANTWGLIVNPLTSSQLAALTGKLDEEEARVHAAVGAGTSPLAPLDQREPGDQTDVADYEIGERQADAMLEHYRMQLDDIAATRARMAGGDFGTCVDCGQPIPFERLAAYPTAKRCADCQHKHERLYAASS